MPAAGGREPQVRVCHIAGARPQFMQAAILFAELEQRGHRPMLVHTGQHYDSNMSRLFFEQLRIPPPAVNLTVGSAPQGAQTGRILSALEPVLEELRPDVIVVDGDTNSALAGALAGAKRPEKVVHVEAGLRSFDRSMPEEINRITVDHISDVLCAPTNGALHNLEREGLGPRAVWTGDLLYDCFLRCQAAMNTDVLDRLGMVPGRYALATIHRSENTQDFGVYAELLAGLSTLPLPVVLPIHPRSQPLFDRYLKAVGDTGRLCGVPPVGYLEMLALVSRARCVLTDSGGVQREAYFAGVPSVVLRTSTEWTEQVEAGWSVVAGKGVAPLDALYRRALERTRDRADVYGGGAAAARIVDAIEARLD